MLQLTIDNSNGNSYVQLTQKQVKDLAETLLYVFDDEVYPSE